MFSILCCHSERNSLPAVANPIYLRRIGQSCLGPSASSGNLILLYMTEARVLRFSRARPDRPELLKISLCVCEFLVSFRRIEFLHSHGVVFEQILEKLLVRFQSALVGPVAANRVAYFS